MPRDGLRLAQGKARQQRGPLSPLSPPLRKGRMNRAALAAVGCAPRQVNENCRSREERERERLCAETPRLDWMRLLDFVSISVSAFLSLSPFTASQRKLKIASWQSGCARKERKRDGEERTRCLFRFSPVFLFCHSVSPSLPPFLPPSLPPSHLVRFSEAMSSRPLRWRSFSRWRMANISGSWSFSGTCEKGGGQKIGLSVRASLPSCASRSLTDRSGR